MDRRATPDRVLIFMNVTTRRKKWPILHIHRLVSCVRVCLGRTSRVRQGVLTTDRIP